MFTTYVVFGEIATKLASNGNLGEALDEQDSGGDVREVNFKTQEELDAYHRGLSDCNGWSEYYIVEGDDINKLKLAASVKGIKL